QARRWWFFRRWRFVVRSARRHHRLTRQLGVTEPYDEAIHFTRLARDFAGNLVARLECFDGVIVELNDVFESSIGTRLPAVRSAIGSQHVYSMFGEAFRPRDAGLLNGRNARDFAVAHAQHESPHV